MNHHPYVSLSTLSSELLRIARCTTGKENFLKSSKSLIARMRNQGATHSRLQKCFNSIDTFLKHNKQNMHKILSGVKFDSTIGSTLKHNFEHFTTHAISQNNLLREKIGELVGT